MQIVQRWVLAALRKRQFFSLADLNEAIAGVWFKLNQRPFRKIAGSRAELYQTIDQPALQPLPVHPFVFAEWKKARVNLDYHVELDGHYYSTPYQLVGKEVEPAARAGRWKFCIGASVWPAMYAAARRTRHDACRAPAEVSSAISGMDADAHHRLGRQGWSVHCAVGGGHPGQQTASGDGLSLRVGGDQAGAQVWRGAVGSRLHPCCAAEDLPLSKREVDPA